MKLWRSIVGAALAALFAAKAAPTIRLFSCYLYSESPISGLYKRPLFNVQILSDGSFND